MRINAFTLLLSIFIISNCCKERQETTTWNIPKMNYNQWGEFIHIDNVISLEETEKCLISLSEKCLISKDHIIILDYKTKIPLVFSKTGRFLFAIGGKGQAEFEYIRPNDIILSNNDTVLEILDASGILSYNLNNGEFLKKERFTDPIYSDAIRFAKMKDGSYLLYTPYNEDYTIYHRTINGIYNGLRKSTGYQLSTWIFSPWQDTCYVLPNYGLRLVEKFTGAGLTNAYELDFGDKNFPYDMLPLDSKEFEDADQGNKYVKSLIRMVENEKYIYVNIVGPEQTYYDVFLEKATKKVIAGPSDVKTGLTIVSGEENKFYGLIYPDFLEKGSLLYQQLAPYLHENESNPLIVTININEKLF